MDSTNRQDCAGALFFPIAVAILVALAYANGNVDATYTTPTYTIPPSSFTIPQCGNPLDQQCVWSCPQGQFCTFQDQWQNTGGCACKNPCGMLLAPQCDGYCSDPSQVCVSYGLSCYCTKPCSPTLNQWGEPTAQCEGACPVDKPSCRFVLVDLEHAACACFPDSSSSTVTTTTDTLPET